MFVYLVFLIYVVASADSVVFEPHPLSSLVLQQFKQSCTHDYPQCSSLLARIPEVCDKVTAENVLLYGYNFINLKRRIEGKPTVECSPYLPFRKCLGTKYFHEIDQAENLVKTFVDLVIICSGLSSEIRTEISYQLHKELSDLNWKAVHQIRDLNESVHHSHESLRQNQQTWSSVIEQLPDVLLELQDIGERIVKSLEQLTDQAKVSLCYGYVFILYITNLLLVHLLSNLMIIRYIKGYLLTLSTSNFVAQMCILRYSNRDTTFIDLSDSLSTCQHLHAIAGVLLLVHAVARSRKQGFPDPDLEMEQSLRACEDLCSLMEYELQRLRVPAYYRENSQRSPSVAL